jgi:hypothetical protein
LGDPRESSSWLLQLPGPALSLVLQKLDPCSLARTALSCSTLSDMVPAAFSRVALHCIAPKTYTRFTRWLQRHNTKLASLMQLSLSADFSRFAWGGPSQPSHLEQLPCPQLRQLRLQNMCAQFEPAGKYKGLLHACSGLTALGLQDCRVPDIHAAMAVITALPALQHLEVQHLLEGQRFHFRGKAGSCF